MSKPSHRANRQKRPSNRLTTYHNRQPARALAAIVSIPVLVCVLAAFSHKQFGLSLWVISSLFVFAFLLFSSLTISVSNELLQWHFGPGLIRKRVATNEIASAELIRTRMIDGWGIHFTRYGWLYNVSGYDAVTITLKNGKQFALGSNDPVGLWEAIQQRIS